MISFLIAAYLWCGTARSSQEAAVSEPNAGEPNTVEPNAVKPNIVRPAVVEPNKVGIGKENPFADVPEETKPAASQQSSSVFTAGKETRPEVFVETVTLKSLDAQSLKAAIVSMSSEYGSISVDAKTNSLIICDTQENLAKIIAQIQRAEKSAPSQLQQQQTAMEQQTKKDEDAKPELFVETIALKFLDAKNLKAALDGMVSKSGRISVNEKNNSLIICDSNESIKKIIGEIEKADKTPRQIMIEMVIVDVKLEDDTEIGINWDVLSPEMYDLNYRQNFTASRIYMKEGSTANIDNATAFNTLGTGGEFSIISGNIRNVVHLIQQKRDVEVLASPRVMMASGQSATIEAVEELPYTERTQSTSGEVAISSTQFKEVGVKLKVSATLTEDNDIFLTVDAEQNVKSGESDTEVPIVDTRRANTSLLLRDHQVVVMGGLRRQEKTKEIDQIPIISNVPFIGELFKSTNTIVNNAELVVFLSPHIYRGEPIPADMMDRYNEIRDKPMLSLPADKKISRTGGGVNGELKTILTSLEKSLSK